MWLEELTEKNMKHQIHDNTYCLMGLMVGCFLKNLDKTENVVESKKWKFHGMGNKETNAVNAQGSTADGCSDENKEFLIWQVEVNGNLGKPGRWRRMVILGRSRSMVILGRVTCR